MELKKCLGYLHPYFLAARETEAASPEMQTFLNYINEPDSLSENEALAACIVLGLEEMPSEYIALIQSYKDLGIKSPAEQMALALEEVLEGEYDWQCLFELPHTVKKAQRYCERGR